MTLQLRAVKMNAMFRLFEVAERLGVTVSRLMLVWIGGLKLYACEDESTFPLVAKSPS